MNYWTFQKREIVEEIEHQGIYCADFSYNKEKEFLENSYKLALLGFKACNPRFNFLNGLIFTFGSCIESPFENIDEVKTFFKEEPDALCFIKKRNEDFNPEDYELLQLTGYQDIITMPVDIPFFTAMEDLDFDFLEDGRVNLVGIKNSYGKDTQTIYNMLNSWLQGIYPGKFSTLYNIIQYHLPYIGKENIISRYPAQQIIKNSQNK